MAYNRTIGMLAGDPRQMSGIGAIAARGGQFGQMTGQGINTALGRDTRTGEQIQEAKLREAIAAIPKNDPQYMQKVAQVMAELGDPEKAAAMMQQLAKSQTTANQPSWAGARYFKDAEGRMYTGSQLRQGNQLKWVMTDVQTGQPVDASNLRGLVGVDEQFMTPEEKAQLEGNQNQLELNQKRAMELGQQLQALRSEQSTLDRMFELLTGPNPPSLGFFNQFLPSFRSSTIEFEQLGRQLGLGLISQVQFGALSEGELKLALDTALPPLNNPKDMADWVMRKKNAQLKLMGEIRYALRLYADGKQPYEIAEALAKRDRIITDATGTQEATPRDKVTMVQVQQTAQKHGTTVQKVLEDMKTAGVEVEGE